MRHFGSDILTVADELTAAYVEIFTAPPWKHRGASEVAAAFRERLERDAHRPGFRAHSSSAHWRSMNWEYGHPPGAPGSGVGCCPLSSTPPLAAAPGS
ncbi:hypothetical protein ACGFNV_04900 [Streptomyces sp. NPDC048751]|uniref:hypothetical protein n=1 Tax=Streptomyces sp. NPDC048751 TaxID=3365591 RepID=UPI0037121611